MNWVIDVVLRVLQGIMNWVWLLVGVPFVLYMQCLSGMKVILGTFRLMVCLVRILVL